MRRANAERPSLARRASQRNASSYGAVRRNVTGLRGAVREGRGFDLYNNLAVGVTWAAERLAVAYLDASALGIRSGSKAEPCISGDALAGASAPSDACP
jgi:hypothetical protein